MVALEATVLETSGLTVHWQMLIPEWQQYLAITTDGSNAMALLQWIRRTHSLSVVLPPLKVVPQLISSPPSLEVLEGRGLSVLSLSFLWGLAPVLLGLHLAESWFAVKGISARLAGTFWWDLAITVIHASPRDGLAKADCLLAPIRRKIPAWEAKGENVTSRVNAECRKELCVIFAGKTRRVMARILNYPSNQLEKVWQQIHLS